MKPTYEQLEQQLAESQREFRSADATIENLQMQVEKLAAENAGLKAVASCLLSEYMMNKATDSEFVACITPNKKTIGTGGVWDMWRLLDMRLSETPTTDAVLAELKREVTEPLLKEIHQLKTMSIGDIRDLINYDPMNGVLTAKVNFSGRQAGSVIGSQTWQGYYAFSLFGKKCFAHRLAWLLHYGEWPSMSIDHINGIKTDNRIENLRLCSLSQNQFNKPTPKNNQTGVKGVHFSKRDKKYVAGVQVNGKFRSAGRYNDLESAKQAVMKLREELAGEFANHGEYELSNKINQEPAK